MYIYIYVLFRFNEKLVTHCTEKIKQE